MIARSEAPLVRGESDLLVFISSVMTREMEPARMTAVQALGDLPFSRPWAFEYTPANSEHVTDAYLRKSKRQTSLCGWSAATHRNP